MELPVKELFCWLTPSKSEQRRLAQVRTYLWFSGCAASHYSTFNA